MTFDAVHRLIKQGDLISLRHELDEGLNPNLSNQLSWTLLMLAAMEGNTRIGELLVSSGADIDATNKFGETALSLAAHAGHAPFIRVLLTNGASTDCHPHGHSLKDWLRVSSGLSQDKIASILELINAATDEQETSSPDY
jgi:ankyrin repeat protein